MTVCSLVGYAVHVPDREGVLPDLVPILREQALRVVADARVATRLGHDATLGGRGGVRGGAATVTDVVAVVRARRERREDGRRAQQQVEDVVGRVDRDDP